MSKRSKANKSLGRILIKDRFGHQNRRRVNNDSMVRHSLISTNSKNN